MSIRACLTDPAIFGTLPAFRDGLDSWRAWLAFLSAFYGEPLTSGELALFRKHTGRESPREGGYPEAVCIVGRQAGKTAIAGLVTAYEAVTAGEDARGQVALSIAQDMRAATRALFKAATGPLEDVPSLAGEIMNRTADSLELRNGLTLLCYPCRPAAVRGLRARVVCIDELAFFIATDGKPTDLEMLRAIRPTLATTRGRLLVLSSPYGQSGALWELYRAHFGRDSETLVWQADAPSMNPLLPADYLARMEQDDPEAYRSEVLGEFRSGIGSLFASEALDAVVIPGRRELLPTEGVAYRAFVDPSGGRQDSYAVAVGHRDGERIVVNAVRAFKAPFNPDRVTAEAAAFLKTYRVSEVEGDHYGGEWPRAAYKPFNMEYRVSGTTTSENYIALLPVVNAGTIELPDLPELLRELRSLVRRTGNSGKDSVSHPPRSHDDQACAVAGLVSMLRKRPEVPLTLFGGKQKLYSEAPEPGDPGYRGDEPTMRDFLDGNRAAWEPRAGGGGRLKW